MHRPPRPGNSLTRSRDDVAALREHMTVEDGFRMGTSRFSSLAPLAGRGAARHVVSS